MIGLIFECMLLGIVAALTGIFYNYTLKYGSIFYKFGETLYKWSEGGGFKYWLANPLGNCIYCNTTWVTIFIMVLYWFSWEELPSIATIVICTLAALGIQHMVIRLFTEYYEKE